MANKLREVRSNANCKLWELAARSGVSASTLSAIERYNYAPRSDTRARISRALGVPVEDIWPTLVQQAKVQEAR